MLEYIKKILGSGHQNTKSIISNYEMESIIKISKSHEDSGLFLNGVSETIRNKAKKTKKRISSYVTRYIRCKFIWKYLAGEGINRAGEGIVRAGYGYKKGKGIVTAGYSSKRYSIKNKDF